MLLAACATTPATAPWSAPDDDALAARVSGEPVTMAEVALYLRAHDPQSFYRALDGLALDRVTRAEAEPLGVRVPVAELNRATTRRMADWESHVRARAAEAGGELDLAVWLQRFGGITLAAWRSRVRRATEVELLQDRLVRFELLRSDRLAVSLLVVDDEKRAREFAARAGAADEFAALAKEHSLHPSRERGGRIESELVADDLVEPRVRRELFAARPGDLVGPFPVPSGRKTFWELYRIEARGAARRGDYPALESEVNESLRTRPVPMEEWQRWRRRVLFRHGFDPSSARGDKQ